MKGEVNKMPYTSLVGQNSIEDIINRAKVSKTVIEVLEKHGCLKNMDETNQISIFNV